MEKVTRWLKTCFGFKKKKPFAPTQKVNEKEKENISISYVLEKIKEMEKVTRWLKTCFGFKKKKPFAPTQKVNEKEKEKKENYIPSSGGGRRDTDHVTTNSTVAATKRSNHAVAVVTASSAAPVAASVSAAVATAVLTKSTNQSRVRPLENWAAVRIQSFYRGHLARRALKALKSIVKIQALFRGYLVRKRVAAALQRMRKLIRAQAYVLAHKTRCFDSIEVEKGKRLSKSRNCSRRQVSHPRDDLNGKLMSSRCQFRQLPPALSLHDSRNCRRSGPGLVGEESRPRYMAETESYRAKTTYYIRNSKMLSLHDSRNCQRSGQGLVGEESRPRYMTETESYRAKTTYYIRNSKMLSLHDSRNCRHSEQGLVGEESRPRYMAETESYRAKTTYYIRNSKMQL